jgi:hypothetical protein
VTLRARCVTLRARWVMLRARWVMLRARWVTLRARWVTLTADDIVGPLGVGAGTSGTSWWHSSKSKSRHGRALAHPTARVSTPFGPSSPREVAEAEYDYSEENQGSMDMLMRSFLQRELLRTRAEHIEHLRLRQEVRQAQVNMRNSCTH